MDRKRILTKRELQKQLEKDVSDIGRLDSEDRDEDIMIPNKLEIPC